MTECDDPWQVLGLSPDATPEQIRSTYVELVKRHPPDRDPEKFEPIRDAYRAASDPQWRSRQRVFGPPPLEDLEELERLLRTKHRRPVGVKAWLAALEDDR